jgi:hypothetical protein
MRTCHFDPERIEGKESHQINSAKGGIQNDKRGVFLRDYQRFEVMKYYGEVKQNGRGTNGRK